MSKKSKAERKYVSPTIYWAFRPLLKFIFYIVFWPKVKGKENIPKKGGAVLAGNHVFVLDPFCVGSGTRRCVHFLGKYEIFKYRFTNFLFTKAGVIPVHRQRKDHAALEAARLRLRPILMTALAFIVGILPLIFASGAYSVARNIMGVALVGGVGIATLLGIFIYPSLYYLIGRIAGFEAKRERNKRKKLEYEKENTLQ